MKVKFTWRGAADADPRLWTTLLPHGDLHNFGVEFTFDPEARDYDYLVVYEGLPFRPGETRSRRVESLACARANTLFLTVEPASIKVYGHHFLRQFGHVLTRQPIDHPGHIDRTPPLRPFYGRPFGEGDWLSYDEMRRTLLERTGRKKWPEVSTVCSSKVMTPAHRLRHDFVMAVSDWDFAAKRSTDGDVSVYGRGYKPISDKAEAMDPYAYHIAIENHIQPGHWTEKISDCFLAGCLPFYYGDPDIGEAFPPDSVIPLDIRDPEAAKATIWEAKREDEFGQRVDALQEARRRVLEDYNTLRVCAEIALNTHDHDATRGGEVMGRHAFRAAHPISAAKDVALRPALRDRLARKVQ